MSESTRHVSKTGGAKDLKIERYDQIPTGPLAELAARYGVGSLKYDQVNGLDNWRNGYPWSWSYRALVGHANDFWAGNDFDEAAYLGTDNEDPFAEDGSPRPGIRHLAAVAWHAFALLEWAETHPELDDRPSTVVARNEAGLAPTEGRLTDDEKSEQFYNGWHAALRHVGEPAKQEQRATQQDRRYANLYHEDGKVYDILPMYTTVRVDLEDGREIHGAITGIREIGTGALLRYDVTYGGGLGRLSFVPPSQITAE
jgi:hypothetical protein